MLWSISAFEGVGPCVPAALVSLLISAYSCLGSTEFKSVSACRPWKLVPSGVSEWMGTWALVVPGPDLWGRYIQSPRGPIFKNVWPECQLQKCKLRASCHAQGQVNETSCLRQPPYFDSFHVLSECARGKGCCVHHCLEPVCFPHMDFRALQGAWGHRRDKRTRHGRLPLLCLCCLLCLCRIPLLGLCCCCGSNVGDGDGEMHRWC